MNCPTCSASMRSIVFSPPQGTWRCSRCGTLKCISQGRDGLQEESEAPELVSRCRQFKQMAFPGAPDWIISIWTRCGINKAIFPPGPTRDSSRRPT